MARPSYRPPGTLAQIAKFDPWHLLPHAAFATATLICHALLRPPLAPAAPPQQDRRAIPL
ncbi:hypothetical protein [Neotabrizicola sp. sgz301269]|uniref:hypothetical protein n=1 Tax=Neotabrizicola sp. sgz301269 TaxID=3276282 RepID=UPI00376FD6B0